MTSIAKLKDKARKHEQKEDWQAAIKVYQKVLDQQAEDEDLDLDLTLFNRIGDLNLRLGETDEAVSFYETAADKYAESGFFNNAIALCNKALRHRPDRPAIYLKLSRLCNEQGFQTDARRWILEYAERQVAAGAVEEALTALEEFAELSDDPEVRELLAQQLAANDRENEAVEQLRTAYVMRVQAGDTEAAAKVAEKARAIDPGVELEAEPVAEPDPEPAEFGAGVAAGPDEPAGAGTPEPTAEGGDEGEATDGGLEVADEAAPDEAAAEGMGLEGLETRTDTVEASAADTVEGLESTRTEVDEEATAADEISGLEVSFSEQEPPAAPEDADADLVGGLETFSPTETGESEPAETGPEGGVEADAEPEAPEEPAEEEEEAEPLPLLDTGYEDELEDAEEGEEGEEGEPLPTLDTGFEDELEEAPAEESSAEEMVAADEAAEEMAVGDAFDGAEATAADEGDLDLDFEEDEVAGAPAEAEPVAEGADAGAEDAMDLDLGSFDLGFETSEEEAPEVAVEEIDVGAIMDRARELVSRGLTGEALRELQILSGSDAGPEVFRDAVGVINEIIRHDANDISALQRRVEYAARIGDGELLIEAYLELAEALERLGAETKARVMYERVLDLDPANEAAREALGEEEEEEDAVDLDAILREMEPDEMAGAAGGEEQESDPNFAAMLNQFKAKVTEHVESDDAGDHYDLGLAFKEMGLIDEAIAEFQTALTGGEERLKVYEELGQCFILKGQYNVALKVFNRALKVPHTDQDELLGVYYHLGQCHEELGHREDARDAYEKVLAIDEAFADVPDRMARL